MASNKGQSFPKLVSLQFLLVTALLAVTILLLFHKAVLPGNTLFSNDGPLGSQMSASHRMPEGFKGGWQDLNSLGFREFGGVPGVTFVSLWLLGPLGYSKLHAPLPC
jgi:hypothetical protein